MKPRTASTRSAPMRKPSPAGGCFAGATGPWRVGAPRVADRVTTTGGVVTANTAWSNENYAGNEVVAHRLDTGQIRRLTKTWSVPYSSTFYGSGGYWEATRVTLSPDGKTIMFASNGGVPDDVSDYTISTGFDITASTPANQFDANGHGYSLTIGATSVTANITTSSSQSCTLAAVDSEPCALHVHLWRDRVHGPGYRICSMRCLVHEIGRAHV